MGQAFFIRQAISLYVEAAEYDQRVAESAGAAAGLVAMAMGNGPRLIAQHSLCHDCHGKQRILQSPGLRRNRAGADCIICVNGQSFELACFYEAEPGVMREGITSPVKAASPGTIPDDVD